jgi:ubiquinone/menaquinone biosynthesis C-methylase UbiE
MHSHGGSTVIVGRKAVLYDRMSGWALHWLYRATADRALADVPARGRVLDIGTGPGHLLVELAGRRPDVDLVGIDPSADMIGHANRRLAAAGCTERVEVVLAGAEKLPFPDAHFDAVVSTLSAHHWAEPSAAVAEQSRVLRRGGQLWVFDLRPASPAAVTQALRAHFSPAALSRPRVGLASPLIVCHRAARQ